MQGCTRILAVLVAILFFISATAALLIVPLVGVVTDREAIKTALGELDQVVLDQVPGVVARALQQQAQQQGIPGVALDEAALQTSLQELMPPGWLDAQTETAVDAVYDAIESGSVENVEVQLDMQPLLQQFQGEAGRQIVATVINGVPDCPEGALPSPGNGGLPSCVPPGLPRAALAEQAHGQLVETLRQNPQILAQAGQVRIPLQQLAGANNPEFQQARQRLERWQRNFQLAQRWTWTLWLIPLGCLMLIALLAVRSLSGLGHWWGWPLLATAVFVFILTLVLPAATTFILRTLPPGGGALLLGTRDLARSLLDTVTAVWLGRVYVQAGVMLALGLLLVAVGALAGARRHQAV